MALLYWGRMEWARLYVCLRTGLFYKDAELLCKKIGPLCRDTGYVLCKNIGGLLHRGCMEWDSLRYRALLQRYRALLCRGWMEWPNLCAIYRTILQRYRALLQRCGTFMYRDTSLLRTTPGSVLTQGDIRRVQCVAVCYRVLQCVAACWHKVIWEECSVLLFVAVCFSVLQRVDTRWYESYAGRMTFCRGRKSNDFPETNFIEGNFQVSFICTVDCRVDL